MARSRNIKPGFFVNADLVELPPLVRLLFIGLWTVADRSGRLEDRPAQIKMQVLPGDDIDTGQALDMLHASNFLTRYEVDGKRYIQISNFAKHQNPHVKEPKSVIPSIPEQTEPVDLPKGNANQIPASCKHRTCLVLAGLIPDSLLLIPDNKPTTAATGLNRTEQVFLEVFETRGARLRELFPLHNFEVVREGCITHFKDKPPPMNPYETVIKWFQRQQVGQPVQYRMHPKPKKGGITDDFEKTFLGTDEETELVVP